MYICTILIQNCKRLWIPNTPCTSPNYFFPCNKSTNLITILRPSSLIYNSLLATLVYLDPFTLFGHWDHSWFTPTNFSLIHMSLRNNTFLVFGAALVLLDLNHIEYYKRSFSSCVPLYISSLETEHAPGKQLLYLIRDPLWNLQRVNLEGYWSQAMIILGFTNNDVTLAKPASYLFINQTGHSLGNVLIRR